jgi:hypothetical protein
MSELQSRNTSPVQAWRCSGVPAAKPAVETDASASAKIATRGDTKNLEPKLDVFFGWLLTAISFAWLQPAKNSIGSAISHII